MNLSGHVWTVGGLALRSLSRASPPPSTLWRQSFEDPVRGTIRLSGRLSEPVDADPSLSERRRALVILVHGLGGSSESTYMKQMAAVASTLGLASLRLNLRGADHEGRDFYHGGLTDDLHAALAHPVLERFERIVCVGFSLGGHIVLRFATEVGDGRVRAVAGVCSPLELGAGARAIDSAALGIYRFYLLRGLKRMHRGLARFGPLPGDPAAAQKAATLRQWDGATVVPRFGYVDVDDYYRRASVGSAIRDLRRPAILLVTEGDPMVPAAAVRDHLQPETPPGLTIRWLGSGGHLALPPRLDLGSEGVQDWRPQLLRWLLTSGDRHP